MAGAYSADLRERALLACERGKLSRAKIAALFRIGESTLHRWLETWRREGRRAAKPNAGRRAEPQRDLGGLGRRDEHEDQDDDGECGTQPHGGKGRATRG